MPVPTMATLDSPLDRSPPRLSATALQRGRLSAPRHFVSRLRELLSAHHLNAHEALIALKPSVVTRGNGV